MKYPKTEGTVRPYRLWNAGLKKPLRWRYYSDSKRAHMGALIEARWASVGTTIDVYNAANGNLLGQYTRTFNSVQFRGA